MTITIYNVRRIGLVVGEKIKQDDEKIYLEYPSVLVPNQQTKQGIQNIMVPPIPNFFAGQFEMLKKFEIEKKDVTLSGAPSQEVIKLYEDYSEKIREAVTGIKKANANVLNCLPKNGKGEPIIQ